MIYIAFIIFTLIVLFFVFYQWQYFMVFSPLIYRDGALCEACSLLSIKTDDGIELEGALYEPKSPKSTLLVFVGRSHDAVGLINRLAQSFPHARVVTFNYRSYGKSGGVANEKNLLADGLKIAALVKKNYGDFYLLGFSIGSSVAAYVASKMDVKALFLLGVFDSIPSLAVKKFGLNIAPIIRYKFPTELFVKRVQAPTYIFVSRDDEITYIENARVLKSAVLNLKYYEEFDGLGHKDLLWDERIVEKIRGVIEQ
jgi:pimeloyl-ACP methyl ester carboxylesterase